MATIDLIEDYLLVWILCAVGFGMLYPRLAILTQASTLILAVMIGSISLTLSVDQFRRIDRRSIWLMIIGHMTMPFLAYGIAQVLRMSPELTVGFVVLGAVTPELVTPVMTELAGGETALSTTILVVIGIGSVVFIPLVLSLLTSGVDIPTRPIVEQLAVAVVVPMVLAVSVRAWQPNLIGRYDRIYSSVSAFMVILIIGGVTAANTAVIRSNVSLLVVVGIGAVTLNTLGYGLGYIIGSGGSRRQRIAAVLSIGMRDFAVAAALIIAAGLPTIATLPAVIFGVVEMTTSAGLVRLFNR